ncbi:hypothetical protein BDZ94DRAFT_1315082 [Collybia nuda]|uniref:Uncharacterized protein n=1 Tax=Collybia nuda TaxID=64659 RepID=A0A9P5XRT3_9AGAR|nr:hypothetical protein BDZ94DRAFT_1315082 [Collybia nuda]
MSQDLRILFQLVYGTYRERLGPAHCSFECAPTFRLDQTTNTCVAESSGNQGDNQGGNQGGNSESKECVPPSYTAFASPSDQCRCYRRPASAQAVATKCEPPTSGHGTAGCKTISPTSSECIVKCDADYIPTADKLDCKPSAPAATVPEDQCSSEETGTYLIADPVLGCRCSRTQETGWCGLPTPETATMTCKHDAGLVNARCTVADCPSGNAPSTTNPLECASSDGTPGRLNGNTDCANGKVYALPGRAGCTCVPTGQTAPQAATECLSPPEDGWAVCSFMRVTTPARCLIACSPPYAITPENTCE